MGVINRYWNNLDEDLSLILKRIAFTTDPILDKQGSEKVVAKTFIARLFEAYDTTVREDEIDKIESLLKERCDKTKNVLAKVVQAVLNEKERYETQFNKQRDDKDAIFKKDPVVKMLKEDSQSKQKKLDDLNAQLEEYQVAQRILKNEINSMKDDVTRAQMKVKDLNSELDNTKFEILRLKNEKTRPSPTVTPTSSKAPFDDKALEELKQEVVIRKKAYDDLTSDFLRLRGDNSYLMNENQLLRKEITSEQVVLGSQTYKMIYNRNEQLKYDLDQCRNIQQTLKMDLVECEKSFMNRFQLVSKKENEKRIPLLEELKRREVEIGRVVNELEQVKQKLNVLESFDTKSQFDLCNKMIEEQTESIKKFQTLISKKEDFGLAKYNVTLEKVVAEKIRLIETLKRELKRDDVTVDPIGDAQLETLQAELVSQKEAFDMISQELDDTASQFFAEQEKNGQLLIKMSIKDDKNLQLVREKLQIMKQLTARESEIDLCKTKIENLNQMSKHFEEAHVVFQQQVMGKEEELVKQTEEIKLTYNQLDKRTRMYNDLLNSFNELKDKYEKLNPFFLEYKKKFEDLEASHGQEVSKVKKLTIENEVLSKRVKGEVFGISLQDDYKKMLTCGICHTKQKDTVITRCFHTFCKDCVNDVLRVRNRKCPVCGLKFGEGDIHEVYL